MLIHQLLVYILILVTNLLFSALYLYPNLSNLLLINFLDTIAQAFATASFLAYLVTLINRNFTAIQHAIFTSLMLVPGMILRGYSGYFVESFDGIFSSRTSNTLYFASCNARTKLVRPGSSLISSDNECCRLAYAHTQKALLPSSCLTAM